MSVLQVTLPSALTVWMDSLASLQLLMILRCSGALSTSAQPVLPVLESMLRMASVLVHRLTTFGCRMRHTEEKLKDCP